MGTTPARPGSFLPVREFFTLDVRSLALFRVALGLMLLLDWSDRLWDLRAHYSDDGIVPRAVITGIQPISVHHFHGSVWFQGVLASVALLAAVAVTVGWRTPLSCLVSWFLLVSVHARNPALMQGGDHLIRMLVFWGIFLPLGSCFSLDSARPGARPPSPNVLSAASFAYVAQICIVYFFAAAWKWAPEWRGEGTAVWLALNAEVFTTRLSYLMLRWPELLRVMTHGSMWLETLGPALLLLPFHVGLQRMIAVALFVLFHMGLALSLELSLFPWVCMTAWLPLLPGSFWGRLKVRLRPAGAGLTIRYDPERPRAARATCALRSWLFLWEAGHEPADASAAVRLRQRGGWCVTTDGKELTGTEALARLAAESPVYSRLAFLARTPLGRWAAAWIGGGRAGPAGAGEAVRPAWTPPGGAVVNVVVIALLVYIALLNLRTFGYGRAVAFPDPNRPPEKWEGVLPNNNLAFGAALGIDQGWGLFAPRPGMYVGWYLAVGIREDGERVDLLDGGRPIDDLDASCKPAFPAGVFWNGRWRKMMMNLSSFDLTIDPDDPANWPRYWRHPGDPRDQRWSYPYLVPGLARYLYREWNAAHEGKEKLKAVEIVWWKEETRPPGEAPPKPRRIPLLRFEPNAGPTAAEQYRYYNPKFSRIPE